MSDNRETYDAFARAYHQKRLRKEDNLWNLYLDRPMILELLGELSPGARVLDLGCGSGLLSRYLHDQSFQVKGVDFSSGLIEIARQENPEIEFSVADVAATPYDEGEFDVVVSGLVMHYLQDLTPAFKEVQRILTSGGLFIFTMHHPFHEVLEIEADGPDFRATAWPYFHKEAYTWKMLDGMELTSYHHTFDCISAALSQSGFVIERIKEAQAPEQLKQKYPEFYAQTNTYPSFCGFRARGSEK